MQGILGQAWASGRIQHGLVIVVSTHYITTVEVLFVVLSLVCRCASINNVNGWTWFMLLAKQYNFRMCLSQLHCRHSLDFEQKWRPGNLSEQVEHVSPQVSQLPFFALLFHCKVTCLLLAVWAVRLARSLSLHFLNCSLLCSAVSAAHWALPPLFLRCHQSSCSCTDLRALLGLLSVSMLEKTCRLKR